jgi:hypothetical protein
VCVSWISFCESCGSWNNVATLRSGGCATSGPSNNSDGDSNVLLIITVSKRFMPLPCASQIPVTHLREFNDCKYSWENQIQSAYCLLISGLSATHIHIP